MATTYNFPPTSRYYGIELATLAMADGEQRVYLRRRFLPPSTRFALLHLHLVADGERLDRIAGQELGDPVPEGRTRHTNDAVALETCVARQVGEHVIGYVHASGDGFGHELLLLGRAGGQVVQFGEQR